MTRINLIAPQKLSDQHLLAEHREIKRIPNVILSGRYSLDWQPSEYVLWPWHVKFFYDKLAFLHNRYILLYKECIKRGFNVSDYQDTFIPWDDDILYTLYNNYTPTKEEIELSRARIEEKLKEKPSFYKWTTILYY